MDRSSSALCLGMLVLTASAVRADEVRLPASKDTSLYEVPPFDVSNGAGEHIFSGNTVNRGVRRALLAFDVAGAIPEGSTIRRVELTLHMSMTIAGPQTTALHRVTADWGESSSKASGEEGGGTTAMPGDATWTHRYFDTDTWTTQGGDFVATESASMSVDDFGFHTWSSPGLVDDVQLWVDRPEQNFGWVVIGNESQSTTAKRFDSRETSNPERQPLLVIEYSPAVLVPALGVWGTLLLCAAGLAMATTILRKKSFA